MEIYFIAIRKRRNWYTECDKEDFAPPKKAQLINSNRIKVIFWHVRHVVKYAKDIGKVIYYKEEMLEREVTWIDVWKHNK